MPQGQLLQTSRSGPLPGGTTAQAASQSLDLEKGPEHENAGSAAGDACCTLALLHVHRLLMKRVGCRPLQSLQHGGPAPGVPERCGHEGLHGRHPRG